MLNKKSAYLTNPPGIGDAGARFANRRAVPRYPLIAAVEIIEPLERTTISGRTSEAGLNGCYIEMTNPLPPKTVVQLRITRGSQTFETWAQVVHTRGGVGMGMVFLQPRPEQRALLAAWLDECKSKML